MRTRASERWPFSAIGHDRTPKRARGEGEPRPSVRPHLVGRASGHRTEPEGRFSGCETDSDASSVETRQATGDSLFVWTPPPNCRQFDGRSGMGVEATRAYGLHVKHSSCSMPNILVGSQSDVSRRTIQSMKARVSLDLITFARLGTARTRVPQDIGDCPCPNTEPYRCARRTLC